MSYFVEEHYKYPSVVFIVYWLFFTLTLLPVFLFLLFEFGTELITMYFHYVNCKVSSKGYAGIIQALQLIALVTFSRLQSKFESLFFQINQRHVRRIAKHATRMVTAWSAKTDSDWDNGLARVREIVGIRFHQICIKCIFFLQWCPPKYESNEVISSSFTQQHDLKYCLVAEQS